VARGALSLATRHSPLVPNHTFDKPSIRILLPSAIAGILLGALFFSLFRDNDRALRMETRKNRGLNSQW
jgi:hypothetical protein